MAEDALSVDTSNDSLLAGRKKYTKDPNPNQRKGANDRIKSRDGRERNVKHPDAEEHGRRPKGGFRIKTPLLILPFPPEVLDPSYRPEIRELREYYDSCGGVGCEA